MAVGLWGALLAGGCQPSLERLADENDALKRDVRHLQQELTACQDRIGVLQEQVATLSRLGSERLRRLIYPVKIEIDRHSGGYDEDGRPGDDGIIVYVRPIDADGHVIKAAGDIYVQLWDLADTAAQGPIGEYVLDVDHARQAWYGRLMTHHFKVKCPWRNGIPPKHPELTVRVQFVDYLTGQTLRAQRVVTVTLPPQAGAAGSASP